MESSTHAENRDTTNDAEVADETFEDSDIEQNDEVQEAYDYETEEAYPVEYAISSYGADYPVDGLVKRIKAGSIFVPQFQRGFVWNIYRASRFIESLLLGLPVPAIFLSKDDKSQRLLVIDGQQRLRTLQYYYDGVFKSRDRVFRLLGVDKQFRGRTYEELRPQDKLRLDDSIMHAIIVKQEKPLEEDPTSIYHIFERLNTGGVQLQPQEIRTCIYQGGLSSFLDKLNKDSHWRDIFGNVSSRMRDQELILRFFALLKQASDYTKPMKEFLNTFMANHRELDDDNQREWESSFRATVKTIHEAIGDKALKPIRAVNAALADSILVAIARRLKSGTITDFKAMKNQYDQLLGNKDFESTISSSTTDEATVKKRLSIATQAFSTVP